MDFIQALIGSTSFWKLMSQLLFGMLLALLIAGSVFRLKGGVVSKLKTIFRDSNGAAAMADFVLTLPIFVTVVALLLQLLMIANASLIVHYSAFSAARSARVHYWDIDVFEDQLARYIAQDNPLIYSAALLLKNHDKAQRAAENAAKFVLISASPVSVKAGDSSDPPSQIISRLSGAYLTQKRHDALLRQAAYSYDSRNTEVELAPAYLASPVPFAADILTMSDAWPITATIRFRKYLAVPIANALLGTLIDKHFFRWIEAEVTVL